MSNNETQAERHVFLGLIAVTTKTLRTGKRTVIRMYKQTYRLCVSVCLPFRRSNQTKLGMDITSLQPTQTLHVLISYNLYNNMSDAQTSEVEVHFLS